MWVGFPGKESTCNAETQETRVQSLGREDPLEDGMATHSSMLAWRIPWTEEPGRLQSIASQRVEHGWNDLAPTNNDVSMPSVTLIICMNLVSTFPLILRLFLCSEDSATSFCLSYIIIYLFSFLKLQTLPHQPQKSQWNFPFRWPCSVLPNSFWLNYLAENREREGKKREERKEEMRRGKGGKGRERERGRQRWNKSKKLFFPVN